MINIKLYPKDKPPYQNQKDLHKIIDKYLENRKQKIEQRIFVIKAPRQIAGKSQFSINELVRFSLRKPKASCGYVAPTLKQSREAFLKITQSFGELIKVQNATELDITFTNGSRIKLFSAESRQTLRGFTIKDLLVLDECAFISDDVWYEFISPWTIVYKPLVLMISTPYFKSGFYYEYFIKGLEGGFIQTFDWASDYPEMFERNAEYLDSIKDTMPYKKFRTEYLAEWLSEDDSDVFRNIQNCIYTSEPVYKQLYCGIDWGTGSSKDYTTICLVNELGEVVKLFAFNELSPTQQIAEVKKIINEYNPVRIQADSTSIGLIYKDLMKGFPIQWVSFTNERKNKWVDQLVVAFEQMQIRIPNDKKLIEELMYYQPEKTATGKITYNAKKGMTDDRVTALYLVWDLYINRNRGTGIRIVG